MSAKRICLPALAAALGAAAISCSTPANETAEVENLDRPTDVAFACYGQLRLVGANGAADLEDPIVTQPHPVESCRIRSTAVLPMTPVTDPLNPPAGQEDLGAQTLGKHLDWYVFALQPTSGTVAVATATVKGGASQAGYTSTDIGVQDGDKLSPGKNSLAVGSMPIAIDTAPSGCHVVTANAGTCDLSVIDVARVAEHPEGLPLVREQKLETAAGEPLLARPAAMVYQKSKAPIGVECPAEPTGLVYIAYPDCHAVGIIDTATGRAVASIRFAADGTATIGDGNLSCPAQCGTLEPVTDGARPVTLDLMQQDLTGLQRLAIGLDNRPVITVVDLDGDSWLPTTVEHVDLEGDVGITDITISDVLAMGNAPGGGYNDVTDTSAFQAQFVYAVATDGSVRVAEVSTSDTECDTQVDPRYLRAEGDYTKLVCLPVGRPGTPPRRAYADGPGIRLPYGEIALSVTTDKAISALAQTGSRPEVDPNVLIGNFAFIAGSSGNTYTVNIDDDNYEDTHVRESPLGGNVDLAVPHQLRDGQPNRDWITAVGTAGPPDCNDPGPIASHGAPRALARPVLSYDSGLLASPKGFDAPYLRQTHCLKTTDTGTQEAAIPEVMWVQSLITRDQTFPDWEALGVPNPGHNASDSAPFDENWTFTWEGALSGDQSSTAVDGPKVRAGKVTIGPGYMNLDDPARPFCAAGVERYDHVVLKGCDPTRGDAQCGLGQTCYVHPDSTVGTGACLPKGQTNNLAGPCRDFLISLRNYAVQDAGAGRLVLSERRHVLRTSPVTGCLSDDQCTSLAKYADTLKSSAHPSEQGTLPPPHGTYRCEADPTRAPGINRCVMTCQASSDCDDGTVCSGGYCIEGTLPPPQCIAGEQRYELHATEAFTAIGDKTGYLHPIVEQAGTGKCVKDPAANPLLIGRIPLDAPPCTGDDYTDIAPNPCKMTVDDTIVMPSYAPGTCTAPTNDKGTLVDRMTTAIRFKNPQMSIHMVDPTYPGDKVCLDDHAGDLVDVPVVYPGFSFAFQVVGGFLPHRMGAVVVSPAKLRRAPDGGIWIIDQGDIQPGVTSSSNTRGQLVRFDPSNSQAAIIR